MDEKKKPEEITDVRLPELPESQLDKVVGGTGPSVSEVRIDKVINTSTPCPFQQAIGGSTGTTDPPLPPTTTTTTS
jgi:hypothetical protein